MYVWSLCVIIRRCGCWSKIWRHITFWVGRVLLVQRRTEWLRDLEIFDRKRSSRDRCTIPTLPWGTKLNHKESQDSRDSNPAAPENRSGALLLRPTVRSRLQIYHTNHTKIIKPPMRRAQERMRHGEVLILSAGRYFLSQLERSRYRFCRLRSFWKFTQINLELLVLALVQTPALMSAPAADSH